MFFLVISNSEIGLAGLFCRFWGCIQDAEDLVLAHDHVLIAIELNVTAGILTEQDTVTHFDIESDAFAVFEALAVTDGDYFSSLWLLFCAIGDRESAPNRVL